MRQLRGYEVVPSFAYVSVDQWIQPDRWIFGTRDAAIDEARKLSRGYEMWAVAVLDRSETPRREIGRAENGVWYWAGEKRRA